MVRKEKKVREFIKDLLRPLPFMKPIVDDGWSLEMARDGHTLHQKTWSHFDGVLEQVKAIENQDIVRSVCHIWPALPGAGVSPVLYGMLCGVEKQYIKSSRRGRNFANYFVKKAAHLGVELIEELHYENYDRIIVSGSDDAISFFESQHPRVVGYGHRESIAVVDGSFENYEKLAMDILQWKQQGCFSVRAIFYIGKHKDYFCKTLAATLRQKSTKCRFDQGDLIQRLQQRSLLEMTSNLYVGEGIDTNDIWVESREGAWEGGSPAPGCVSVFSSELTTLLELIKIPSHQRQGVALSAKLSALGEILLDSGFTHISNIGSMQSPPLSWLHDGRSNVEMFTK